MHAKGSRIKCLAALAADTSHKEESLAWPSNLLVSPGLEWAAGIHGSGPRSSFCIANSRCNRGTHKAVYGPNSADEQFDKAKDAIQKNTPMQTSTMKLLAGSYLQGMMWTIGTWAVLKVRPELTHASAPGGTNRCESPNPGILAPKYMKTKSSVADMRQIFIGTIKLEG